MDKARNFTLDPGVVRALSLAGLIVSILLCIYGWQTGIFTSQAKLQATIAEFGAGGALIFIIFQAVQVVVPIVPGGLSCLAGVLLFGAFRGFLYNYIGICIGSVIAFLVARSCGKELIRSIFGDQQIRKYEDWTAQDGRFSKMFAAAIFLPVAPDDFLCYLAGTTSMPLGRFLLIILLGKPGAIALYSLGLKYVFTYIPALVGSL
ncbi:MAG: TVP38/TMEM64 family protein [Anaerovoracaceae bacterium]|jgi:uncharacterized membrane protein YdjX (TVP38/TMEM64 family)